MQHQFANISSARMIHLGALCNGISWSDGFLALLLQHHILSRFDSPYPIKLVELDPAQSFLYGDTSIFSEAFLTMARLAPKLQYLAHAIARVGFLSLAEACSGETASAWANMVFLTAETSLTAFEGPYTIFQIPESYPTFPQAAVSSSP